MKTFYKIYLILSAIVFCSCQDEIDLKYSGPTVVEFKNYYYEKQTRLGLVLFEQTYPSIAAAENSTLKALTVMQPTPGITLRDSILVQLVGPQLESDTEVTYQIDESPTAVEGVHFDIIGNSGKVLIKANTSSGYIYLDVLNSLGAADPDRVTLSVTLTGNGNILPSENYKTFTYNIIK